MDPASSAPASSPPPLSRVIDPPAAKDSENKYDSQRTRHTLQHYVSTKHLNRPQWVNFVTGGAAALSGWVFVHPFDLMKVRSQLSTEKLSMFQTGKQIVKNEGVLGLYSGIGAAMVRQLTYGNLRLGFYATLKQNLFPQNPNVPKNFQKQPSNLQNLGMGLGAGGFAAFLSNPIEVSLVRMQADGRLPEDQRRNYKNVVDSLARITREEGILALWKGSSPTVARAMVVNALQVGGYDVAKTTLKTKFNLKESILLHLSSSLIAGFVYSLATLPIDTAKTRIQTQRGNEYTSIVQTIVKIGRKQGPLSLWNGFGAYFARSGGHTVMMFLFLEQYKKLSEIWYPSSIYS